MLIKNQSPEQNTTLELSQEDTYQWAHKQGASWPCSVLSGKSLFVEIAPNGDLVDIRINNKLGDCPNDELQAIINDHLGTIQRPTLKTLTK